MSNTFKQLKREVVRDSLIKSSLYGLAAAALSVGVLAIVQKQLVLTLSPLYPLALGAACFAVAFLVSFLIHYRTTGRLARELDEKHHLREGVQTMLEFEGRSGDMLELQREHTEQRLASLPARPALIKRIILPAAALILSIAVLLTGLILPTAGSEPDPGPPPKPFLISEWQIGAMEALIEEVSYAKLEESVKTELVTRLRNLLEHLKTVQYYREMDEAVITSIVDIDLYVENINTYKKVSLALFASTQYAPKKIAVSIITLNGVGFGESISPIRDTFTDAMYKYEVLDFADEVLERLGASSVPEDAPLRIAVESFANALNAIAEREDLSFNEAQAEIDKTFTASSDAIGQQMSAQYNNLTIRTRIIKQLIEIFMIDEDDIPPLLCDLVPNLELLEEGDDEGGNKEDAGGYGEGNELWGSNDTVYDTLFLEGGAAHVKYGDVFGDYYPKVEELLLNGNLSEETKKLIIDYFRMLSDGSKK